MDSLQTETKGTVLIKTAEELTNYTRGEETQLENMIKVGTPPVPIAPPPRPASKKFSADVYGRLFFIIIIKHCIEMQLRAVHTVGGG